MNMTLSLRGELRGILCAVFVTFWAAGAAWAAITNTGATVSTIVQERIDSAPASVNSDRETLGVDALEPPLGVAAGLTSTDLDGTLVSLGQGFSDFDDPARLDQANPEELGAEVACYSNAESVSYSVQALAVESRTVVFSTSEIDFALDGTQSVESRVFFSGAVIFWSIEPTKDLDEMLAELSVTVTRDDTGSPLFETGLEIVGTADAEVMVSSAGPIRSEQIGVDELLAEGADAESIAILEEVNEEGTLVIVLIPPQEHAYTYTVTANEAFDLTATLQARVRNMPDGTGVAAVVGRPFRNLAEFIELGLPGVSGAAVQQSLNEATAKREIGLVSQADSNSRGSGGPLCGAFGIEAVALLAFGMCLAVGGRRGESRSL